ncbi:MAG: Dam family site-specific DNA-(adenine-N6)-methyltransferase [Christensenellales bacterium]
MQLISKTEIIKSPLNFTGGKYKLLPQLLPLFPNDISTFVDLFCGGCNVGINASAKKIICNDIDSNLIGLFSFFKRKSFNSLLPRIQEVINDFNLSDSKTNGYSFYNCNSASGLGNFNRIGFLKLRDAFNTLSKNNENYFLYMYILIVYAFNNQVRFNSDGKFNLPVGKRDFNVRMQNKLKNFLSALEQKNIFFSNFYFSDIKVSELEKNDFVYADPPYLITCATYNEKSWNEKEEQKLLDYLDELSKKGIRFALSNVLSTDNKTNIILQKWLEKQKYNCHHLDFSYKNSNYHKKNIAKTDEVLITNY